MSRLFDGHFWSVLFEEAQNWLITQLPSLILTLLLFFIGFKLISMAIKKLKKLLMFLSEKQNDQDPIEVEKRINTLVGILHAVLRIILWAILLMIVLQKMGIDIAPLLAGAGILGLAIGFGAQELVRDFISGFFIILENQIRSGDVAIINGTAGLVEKIGLRTIVVRDFSGTVHIFQNGKINTLSNMTKDWSAISFDIAVALKENTEQVMEVMRQVGTELEQDPAFKEFILEPIEVLGLDQFTDNAMVIRARLKTKPSQQWALGREFRKRLKLAFERHKIEIPYPQTTLSWVAESPPLSVTIKPPD